VLNVFEASVMDGLSANEGVIAKIAAGYFRKRSGDLMVQLNPGWTEHAEKGTTHGAPYVYDTHVPLIFYGAGIKQGRTWQEYSIADIAPSIAALLGISSPGGATGKVIAPLLQKP
jgi:arylsulfatase A-like enzyme